MSAHLPFGLHADIPASRYHSDDLCAVPTLSSGLAKTLLSRTPRHARLQHPRLCSDAAPSDDASFSLGSVAHELILGRGGGYAVLDFADWRTKAAKEAREEAYAAGRTPILTDQFERAEHMAAMVRAELPAIPGCEALFQAGAGQAETVGLWQDVGGPVCRMMIDWMGPTQADIFDLKTTDAGLSEAALMRTVENLGYDLSAAFYLRGLHHLLPDLAGRFRWRWVFVEASEPFEVRVIEPDGEVLGLGARKAALAIAKWHRCLTTDRWPGYPREVTRLGAPGWAEAQWNEREMADPDFDGAVLLDHTVLPALTPDTLIFGERQFKLPKEAA